MLTTTWQPIIVGVDATPAAVRAARFAAALADRAGVPCHLVHAVPEVWTLAAAPNPFAGGPEALNRSAATASANAVRGALYDQVPAALVDALEVRLGRPTRVLSDAAHERGAGLIVLGGKHHSTLGRWVAGSTAHAVVRTASVPVLVTMGDQLPHRRVLCAVDVSDAAGPTIQNAVRWADLLSAELTVLHAIEPLPIFAEAPFAITPEEHETHVAEALARLVWPTVPADAERLVRPGEPDRIVAEEVTRRNVDLVVVGSHGRGWFDRVLIGSITERLLGALPAPLLVVPVGAPTARRGRRRVAGMAARR
jgi:nucleotide-binding universal stress UspA family protein